MTFRTLVMLCLAAMAGGIMTRGASEGSLPSKRSAARHRAAKDSGSGGLLGIIADAVEGLADALGGSDEADEADDMEMHKTSLDVDKDDEEDDEMDMHKTSSDEADEADETEMHKTSLDEADEVETHIASHRASSGEAGELGSDDVDDEDEEDEAEDLSPTERRAWSALRDFYGERVEDVLSIMDRGTAPDASEDDKEAAKEYLDKAAELVEPLVDEADEMEMHKTSLDVDKDEEEDDEMDMHKTSLDADKDDDEDEEDEEDMTPAELRTLSTLQGFYGEDRLEEVAGIVDRGMAPGASEGDKVRAQEYLDKVAELVKGADASGATPADTGDEMEMHQTSFDEARSDREADEIAEHVVHGVGTIVDAVAPLATELLDAVLGDDEDEA